MTSVNSIAYQTPQFSVLSESQIKDIHLAALEVLRRTGIRFHHEGAVEMLREAGAFVSDGNLVKLPARMVEDAISSVPGRVVMCDRDGEPAMYLEGTKVYFGTGSDCLNLIDPETGELCSVNTSNSEIRDIWKQNQIDREKELKDLFLRCGTQLIDLNTNGSIIEPLARYFLARGKRR